MKLINWLFVGLCLLATIALFTLGEIYTFVGIVGLGFTAYAAWFAYSQN